MLNLCFVLESFGQNFPEVSKVLLFYSIIAHVTDRSPLSSQYCAGRRLTLHIRTLEVRPESSKKLGIVYDHNVKGMM